jgi:hypothetical protein
MNAASLPSLGNFFKQWYTFKPPAPQRGSIFEILKEKHASYKVYPTINDIKNLIDFNLALTNLLIF